MIPLQAQKFYLYAYTFFKLVNPFEFYSMAFVFLVFTLCPLFIVILLHPVFSPHQAFVQKIPSNQLCWASLHFSKPHSILCFRVQLLIEHISKGVQSKNQSPCHHGIPQLLLSLLPLLGWGCSAAQGRPFCWDSTSCRAGLPASKQMTLLY